MFDLSSLETEILDNVPDSGVMDNKAYVVWRSRHDNGRIEMGPVRLRRIIQGVEYFDCSPFPGAWDYYVTRDQILRVRALGALVCDNDARRVAKDNAAYQHVMRHGCFTDRCEVAVYF